MAEPVEAIPRRDGHNLTPCPPFDKLRARNIPVAELVEATGLLGRILYEIRIPRYAAGDASGKDGNA